MSSSIPPKSGAYPSIAIIGLHGRFPNCSDPGEFFDNLVSQRDAISLVPGDRWDWEGIMGEPDDISDKSYSNCGGFMPHADCFDAQFFGILPREVESMDPQQRLFLQTAWAALEDAGQAPSTLAGRKVGVFVGVGNADYPVLMRRDEAVFDAYRATGMALTSIANRVSFILDLRGPSQSIDTACSSSLVAIHRAIHALNTGDCELAIAGGVNLLLGPELFIAFSKAGMLSRTGRCRVFDATADGYVRGEGTGAIVLCPLDVAQRRGDYIYAVIRGSAENHGGRAHSFTAPNVHAQADVIATAWSRAGVPLSQAAFIETHGTGTPLGDPIEINGLKKVLGNGPVSLDGHRIALGAVKSHIGHLEAAAGITAIIKTALSLGHGVVPGNLNHETQNPHVDLAGTNLHIPTENVPLINGDQKACNGGIYAGVSSFGFGGVNAHVVMQSSPPRETAESLTAEGTHLVVLSAKSPAALLARTGQLFAAIDCGEELKASRYDEVFADLQAALALPVRASTPSDPITLAVLQLTPPQIADALVRLQARGHASYTYADVRDCVSLQEIAAVVSSPGSRCALPASAQHMAVGVAIPRQQMASCTLAQIARSLLEGRDAMRERLAFVVSSKNELLNELANYIADPGRDVASYFTGSARRNGSPRPSAGTAELRAWAAYFVSERDAKVSWQDLHGDAPVPARIPMPAYPFKLERIWYRSTKRHRTSADQPTHTLLVNAPNRFATASPPQAAGKIPAGAGLIGLWQEAWAGSPVQIPNSLLAIASLVESCSNGGAHGLNLSGIRFGAPAPVRADTDFGHRRKGAAVQCVQQGRTPFVYAEARLIGPSVRPELRQDSQRPIGARLDAGHFHAHLAGHGLVLALGFGFHEDIEAAPDAISVLIKAGRAGSEDAALFWVRFWATTIAGLHYLQQSATAPVLLPYRIASLKFDPSAARQPLRVTVIRHGSTHASVIVRGGDGADALVIERMELRPAPERFVRAAS